jgi:WD40 repeat protein
MAFDKSDIIKSIFNHYNIFQKTNLLDRVKNKHLLDIAINIDRIVKEQFRLTGHDRGVTCLLPLPDGDVASGSYEGVVRIWSRNNDYKCIKELKGHPHLIWCLTQLPNGNIASGAEDSMRIWCFQNDYKCIHTLEEQDGGILRLLLLENCILISGHTNGHLKMRDFNGEFFNALTIEEFDSPIRCLMAIENDRFASTSGKVIRLSNNKDYKSKFQINTDSEIRSLIIIGNGNLASGHIDDNIRIWDSRNNYSLIQCLTGHNNTVSSLIYLAEGYIVSGSFDATIRIWDIKKDIKCIKSFISHGDWILSLALLSNGNFASASDDNTIKIWKF